jgi:hypothetical protein
MSNNFDNENLGCLGLILLFVILFLHANGVLGWFVGIVVGLFIAYFLCITLYNNGLLWWGVVAVGWLSIAYILYINGLAWIVYAVGGLFVVWGLIGLVQSYQLKQKAKRLDLISQEISKNWK